MIFLILLLLTHLPLHMKINELEIQLTKLLDNLFWISNQMEKLFIIDYIGHRKEKEGIDPIVNLQKLEEYNAIGKVGKVPPWDFVFC